MVAGMRARASQKGKLERTEGQALLLTQQRKEVTEEEDLKTADGKVVHKVSHGRVLCLRPTSRGYTRRPRLCLRLA